MLKICKFFPNYLLERIMMNLKASLFSGRRLVLLLSGVALVFTFAIQGRGEEKSVTRIFVNKGTFTLTLVKNNMIVGVYPVAIGRGVPGWPSTPEGNFVIENKSTLGCRKRCSSYGTRFMGLNPTHVGIHGTNEPHKIGTPASHGCIRMLNRDAEMIFEKVSVGTKVTILNRKTVIIRVKMQDKNIALKCLPLTPDMINYCSVKPLVRFVGGSIEKSAENKNTLVIMPSENEQFKVMPGTSSVADKNGNTSSFAAPVLYKKGEFFASIDDILSFFKLKSTLLKGENKKGETLFVALIEPHETVTNKEENDRDDIPREPFTQIMSLK